MDVKPFQLGSDALHDSEMSFRVMFDQAGAGIAVVGADRRFQRTNRALQEMLGCTAGELDGKRFADFVFPDDAAIGEDLVHDVLAGRQPRYHTERRYVRKDGRVIWARVTGTVVRGVDGRPLFGIGMMEDITEQRRAEKEREAFGRLANRLAASASIGEVVEAVREESERLLGWDAHYFAVRNDASTDYRVLSFVDTVDGRRQVFPGRMWPNPATSPRASIVLTGKPVLFNRPPGVSEPAFIRFGDTNRLSASVIDAPVSSGGEVIGVLSVQSYTPYRYDETDLQLLLRIADVVAPSLERARAQEALRHSEERYRRLFEDDLTGDLVADADGKILVCNPAFVKTYAFAGREEAIGSNLASLFSNHESWADFVSLLKERRVLERYECEHRRRDGAIVHVIQNVVGTFNDASELTQFRAYIFDDSERKRAEHEREAFGRLAARLAAGVSVDDMVRVVWQESERLLDWDAHFFAVKATNGAEYGVPAYIDTVDGRKQVFPGDAWPAAQPGSPLWPVLSGRPELINRDSEGGGPDLAPFGNRRPSASLMFVPVCSGDRVIGVLSVQSYTPRKYGESHLEILQRVADILAPALERACAEEAMRESERRYRTLFESSPDALFILDADGRILDVNEVALARYGYTRDELLAMSAGDLAAPALRADAPARIRQALQAATQFESRQSRKDGSEFPVEIIARPITLGGVRCVLSSTRDITERKRAEGALQASAREWQTTFDAVSDAVWVLDSDQRVLRCNAATTRIFGKQPGEVIGRACWEIVHGTPEPIPECPILRMKKSRKRESMELCSGERWLEISVDPILDGGGGLQGAVYIASDITNRKRAEAERDRLFNYSMDMLCVAGFDGYLKQPNPAWERTLGWSNEELCGRPWLDFVHPDDRAATVDVGQQLAEGRSIYGFENRYRCRDGSYRWLSWNSFPLLAEGQILAVARDVTEAKRARDALARSEGIFRAAIENADGVPYQRDLDTGVYSFVGAGVGALLGIPKEAFTPRCLAEMIEEWSVIEPAGCGDTHACGVAFQRGEIPRYRADFRVRLRDGSVKWINDCSVPIRDPASGTVVSSLGILQDVTERKRGEQARLLNETRLDTLVKLSQMTDASLSELAHFVLEEAVRLTASRIGYVAFANEDETVLTMYAWSGHAMAECAIQDKPVVYPVAETGLWGEAVRQRRPIITNDYAAPNPWKKGFPEGHVRVIRHMNLPVFDGDRIVLVAGVGNKENPYDETDVRQLQLLMDGMWKQLRRRQIEQSLCQSEERFRLAMEAANEGLFDWHIPTGRAYFSPRYYTMLGYEPDEMPAAHDTWHSLLHPDDREATVSRIRQFLEQDGGYFEAEFRLRTKSGGYRWILSRSRAIEHDADGRPTRVVGTHLDITERKQADNAIHESQERTKALFTAITDAVYVHRIDAEGRPGAIIDANEVACRMLGYTREEMLGKDIRDIDAPEFPADVKTVIELLKSGRDVLFEQSHVARDGRRIPVEIHACAFQLQGETVLLSTVRDITERKRAEAELARYRNHLEDLVEQRSRELEESIARLRLTERLASVGTLAAGIAHEINNPVGMILLAAENAVKLRGGPEAEVITGRALDRIIANAKRCSQIVRSVLQFARQEPTDKWPTDLNGVVAHAVELTRQYAAECGAVIRLELAADLPDVMANPVQIEQVFVNLIRNAIESDACGVCVSVRSDRGPGSVRVVVGDSGRGLSPEQRKRIFDPFYTTRQRKGGTGLGLSISHGIITEHGGSIEVQSELGRGTNISVDLPCAPPSTQEASDAEGPGG